MLNPQIKNTINTHPHKTKTV